MVITGKDHYFFWNGNGGFLEADGDCSLLKREVEDVRKNCDQLIGARLQNPSLQEDWNRAARMSCHLGCVMKAFKLIPGKAL